MSTMDEKDVARLKQQFDKLNDKNASIAVIDKATQLLNYEYVVPEKKRPIFLKFGGIKHIVCHLQSNSFYVTRRCLSMLRYCIANDEGPKDTVRPY